MPRFAPLLITVLLLATPPAHALGPQPVNYHKAFALLDAGHPEQAYMAAQGGGDVILNKVLRGIYMAQPNNDASFEELAAFLANNPGWPGSKDITAIAEQKIPVGYSPAQVVAWFDAHPARSLAGFYRQTDAMDANDQATAVGALARKRWVEGDFSPEEQVAFYNRFSHLLGPDSHIARLDRLLWKNDVLQARRMYAYVEPNRQALAEARLALENHTANAATLAAAVPPELLNDSGLMYERLKYDVHDNLDEQAIAILQSVPGNFGKPDAWWELRQTVIRRLIARKDYDLAAQLAADHGQTESKELVQGEFLAGWLDLRFLNKASEAIPHFQALYDSASTPVTRARGAYWLGRADEAAGDKQAAEPWYETAAALNLTYYGQLAATKLYDNPTVTAKPEPAIPASIRAAFYNRDIVQAVEHLHQLGETDRAHTFFRAATDESKQRADFALLTELAYRVDRPDLAIEAAKAANQKNFMVAAGGFPLLDLNLPQPPEPAFTHALIRQESMFNPAAGSPVGASGLMQLMPATAREVARKIGLRFKRPNDMRLTDSATSLKLGTYFVQSQIEAFNGSYILALAGYNAGPHRVREWLEVMGDPRDPAVDPIDWVEEIPLTETRNYVQRIIENLQVYRARLNGGQAPLLIIKDLRR